MAAPHPSTTNRCLRLAADLKRQAQEQVIAFWLAHGIDDLCGGYWTDLNRNGSRYGDGRKWIVVQTRTLYSMCLAYQMFGDPVYLAQAAQGAAFFREHFRDTKHGGWFYCVSRDGSVVLDDSKQPYGLAFVSFSLAEYARLSGDDGALQDAIEAHEKVMDRCWDVERGGLLGQFSADWQPVERIKRVDTHLHTMEGVSALYHATGDARYLERMNLLANTVLGRIGVDGCYDPEHGCTHERFHEDWHEEIERQGSFCNYGHAAEAGWFLSKLAAYTGDKRQAELGKGLVDWAIEHGLDRDVGGLYDYGRPSGEVLQDLRVWWNQAALLGALAFLFRITAEERYLDLLEQHVAYIERFFVDHEYGGWYCRLYADGSLLQSKIDPPDHKGSRWKSPYHVLQSLYHAHNDLRRAAGVQEVAQLKRWADLCL